jgi:hypothetical protein
MCEPCNQLLAVQSNHTLSNFEQTHVDGAKHMGRLTAIREAARLEAECNDRGPYHRTTAAKRMQRHFLAAELLYI